MINADLNIDDHNRGGDGGLDVLNDPDNRDGSGEEHDPPDIDDDEQDNEYEPRVASAKSARPSLIEGLRTYNPDRQPPGTGKKPGNLDI